MSFCSCKDVIFGVQDFILWLLCCRIFRVKRCQFDGPTTSFCGFKDANIWPLCAKILWVKRSNFEVLNRAFQVFKDFIF